MTSSRLLAGLAALGVLLLLLVDHSGPAPVVQEALAPTLASASRPLLDTSGDARVMPDPTTLHLGVDSAGLLSVTVTLRSQAGQALLVDGRARLISKQGSVPVADASGNVVLPAHGSAVLTLSGVPPLLPLASVMLHITATTAQNH